MSRLGVNSVGTARSTTASATLALLDRINDASAGDIVAILANAEVATSETAMGECLSKSSELAGNLDGADWDILDAIGRLSDERRSTGELILAELREAIVGDEHVLPLAPSLKTAQSKAVRLLTKQPVASPLPPPSEDRPKEKPGRKIVNHGAKQNLALPEAKELISKLDRDLRAGQTVQLNISWIVEEDGSES
jgi:hypothetical protein